MKTFSNLVEICGCICLLLSCRGGERVVERPVFGVSSTRVLEIDKIMMNDTATVMYVNVYQAPNNWICLDSSICLRAEGKDYPILTAEGIRLGEYYWMPESGQSSFRLVFPPLPRGVESVDFIESNVVGHGASSTSPCVPATKASPMPTACPGR